MRGFYFIGNHFMQNPLPMEMGSKWGRKRVGMGWKGGRNGVEMGSKWSGNGVEMMPHIGTWTIAAFLAFLPAHIECLCLGKFLAKWGPN